MIRENVPIDEAEAMVAKGARILEHKRDGENRHVCLVEVLGDAESAAEPEQEPKRRRRPPKAGKG